MSDVDVRADGEHRYLAAITTAAGRRTEHVVASDPQLLEELRMTAAEEPFLVRQVVDLLARAADAGEQDGSGATVPEVIDLRELDRERPDLLASLPLREGTLP
ncbi:hypothetical protein [Kineococcus rubinsiae]|uniref:hypothetical protein n=1 Tax=Kineococcus rubinsiae TaxID=2609562 RepID=UPI001430AD9E|nr:hypothetical protein [Kineococcus rubinsiae]NIZ92640.1 hypothetical protein [Kineococcus rubinsiae]